VILRVSGVLVFPASCGSDSLFRVLAHARSVGITATLVGTGIARVDYGLRSDEGDRVEGTREAIELAPRRRVAPR
jgi:hypothetical protein